MIGIRFLIVNSPIGECEKKSKFDSHCGDGENQSVLDFCDLASSVYDIFKITAAQIYF